MNIIISALQNLNKFFLNYPLWVFSYFMAVNLIAFIMYGADKAKAKAKKWRIPEANLIGIAVIGGSLGSFLGMKLFRHKTKHMMFQVTIPLLLLLHLIFILAIFFISY